MATTLWSTLRDDFTANSRRLTWWRFVRGLLVPDKYGALVWLRLYHWCERHGLPTWLPYRVLLHAHGMEVYYGTRIGAGLYLPHPFGVLIAKHTRIGVECGIYGMVRFLGKDQETPVLGDRVVAGDGARFIGGVQVGEGAYIGAGAVVTKDIPPHSVAVGIPARVVKERDMSAAHAREQAQAG